ncbi:MAG TPA: response regulator transcription factor [Actinomycetota bacterium]|nr:response regulator transcription factor [Actinomycetota bacterium]
MAEGKIAVVEDEPTIARAIATRLESEGFSVEVASDGPSGVELCRRMTPDLVILDVMLPGFDGIEVCRRIQKERHVPVIMLTALDDETDKLVGLGVGADDYVTKPFSARELVARVKAVLRRVERAGRGEPPDAPIRVAGLELDADRRRATVRGDEVHLTPLEFDLLYTLAERPGVVYSRDALMGRVWGHGDSYGSRTVDSHIRSIRRKVGGDLIRTVHGIGYSFTEEPAT